MQWQSRAYLLLPKRHQIDVILSICPKSKYGQYAMFLFHAKLFTYTDTTRRNVSLQVTTLQSSPNTSANLPRNWWHWHLPYNKTLNAWITVPNLMHYLVHYARTMRRWKHESLNSHIVTLNILVTMQLKWSIDLSFNPATTASSHFAIIESCKTV